MVCFNPPFPPLSPTTTCPCSSMHAHLTDLLHRSAAARAPSPRPPRLSSSTPSTSAALAHGRRVPTPHRPPSPPSPARSARSSRSARSASARSARSLSHTRSPPPLRPPPGSAKADMAMAGARRRTHSSRSASGERRSSGRGGVVESAERRRATSRSPGRPLKRSARPLGYTLVVRQQYWEMEGRHPAQLQSPT